VSDDRKKEKENREICKKEQRSEKRNTEMRRAEYGAACWWVRINKPLH
jgi:hypothetical protein